MVVEISKEYVSTFNRTLQTQLYNEIMHDYSFPRAVCRSLSELFIFYFDLYFGNQRKEGQIIFTAVSSNVPPGVPVNEMDLVPAIITTYDSDDCAVKDQKELLEKRIVRITNEALNQGALLTQADIAILLGESTKTISRHIAALEENRELVPTRGKWKDIGPGVSHKKKILELYLKGYEYTEIERKTRHSGEAIMRYVKDFAKILLLTEDGFEDNELRLLTGLSEKTIQEYKELIETYSTEEYQERLEQLHEIIGKKNSRMSKETVLKTNSGGRNR